MESVAKCRFELTLNPLVDRCLGLYLSWRSRIEILCRKRYRLGFVRRGHEFKNYQLGFVFGSDEASCDVYIKTSSRRLFAVKLLPELQSDVLKNLTTHGINIELQQHKKFTIKSQRAIVPQDRMVVHVADFLLIIDLVDQRLIQCTIPLIAVLYATILFSTRPVGTWPWWLRANVYHQAVFAIRIPEAWLSFRTASGPWIRNGLPCTTYLHRGGRRYQEILPSEQATQSYSGSTYSAKVSHVCALQLLMTVDTCQHMSQAKQVPGVRWHGSYCCY